MQVNQKGGKLVDYLFKVESSQEAVLIEIKTPTMKLLGSKYRGGVYRRSADLSGAQTQTLDYRATLISSGSAIFESEGHDIRPLGPKCVVIAGNAEVELDTPEKRRSFELFRHNSKDVEFVTYDELFRKIEVLAKLFNLVRAPHEEQAVDG